MDKIWIGEESDAGFWSSAPTRILYFATVDLANLWVAADTAHRRVRMEPVICSATEVRELK